LVVLWGPRTAARALTDIGYNTYGLVVRAGASAQQPNP